MSYTSSSSLKRKRKRNSKEKKSRKIDKRKRKMLVSKAFHNSEVQTVFNSDGFDKLASCLHWHAYCSLPSNRNGEIISGES